MSCPNDPPSLSRRQTIKRSGVTLLGGALVASTITAVSCTSSDPVARVVVVGGGFAGAGFAKAIKGLWPSCSVILVEAKSSYVACPFSNLVFAGLRSIAQQHFDYSSLRAVGVEVVHDHATQLDGERQTLTLAQGRVLPYDRLVAAPGIDMRWNALPGYDQQASQRMPHAWLAGAQTSLLRDQLQAMPEDGVVAITVPEAPYRCPPGPYERASLIAHYLKSAKPKARIVILDAKDQFSKQTLFQNAWKKLYGAQLEWHGASSGARVVAVDTARMTLETEFDRYQVDVANVIPPQQAGRFARENGLTDATGWCPVSPLTFESRLQSGVHVIGDAAIANAMPKSAFAAAAQARLCAVQIVRLLNGDPPVTTKLLNTCYSLVAPDYGISVAGVYTPERFRWAPVPGAGGTSDLAAATSVRQQEAAFARAWFERVTSEVFGRCS